MRILRSSFFVIAVLFTQHIVCAQGGGQPPSYQQSNPPAEFMAKMGEILTSPPNTAAIERFGGVDIELNTGVVKKSIALKPFVSRGITVPVSLGYSSLGLRVNEHPSRVGMAWSLTAGGQISRVIYGKDDLIATRYPPDFTMNPAQDDPQATAYAFHLFNEGNRDATPDIFTYSFGNYYGKFFFDNTNTIRQVDISNVKIEYNPLTNSAWTFKVSTPDGSTYLFGGPNATEKTKVGGTMNFSDFVANAWQLISITDKNGHSVYLNYEEDFISLIMTDKSQTQYKNSPFSEQTCVFATEDPQNPLVVLATAAKENVDVTNYMSSKPKRLRKIYNAEGDSLIFDYSANGYPEKLISQVSYYYKEAPLQIRYVLDYELVMSGISTMPFLVKITEKGSNGGEISGGYKFNYYSRESVSPRFTYSQDHWGFYNGKSNTTLIPVPEDPIVAQNFPYATANREPDPRYAIAGMLSSVAYPTGGKDSIVYEPNTKTESKDVNGYTDLTQMITGVNETSYTYTNDGYFTIHYDTKVKITLSSLYSIPNTPAPHAGSHLVIINTATGQTVFNNYIFPPVPPLTGTTIQNYYINLPIGNYSYKTGAQGSYVQTTSVIRVRNGIAPNMQNVQTVIGGMRVKKVITMDNTGKSDLLKRYYYGTISNKEESTAQYDKKANYYVADAVFHTVLYFSLQGCLGTYCQVTNNASMMFSSPKDRLYTSEGKLTEYTSVIESIGGDNFESGAVEHKYNVAADASPQLIRGPVTNSISPYTNSSVWSLGETEKNIYKKVQAGLVKIQSSQYQNIVDPRIAYDFPFYFLNQMEAPVCSQWNGNYFVGPDYIHSLYSITRFNIGCAWKYLKTQKEIVYDENGLNPVTTQIDFEYNDLQHLNLTKRKFTNSKGELLTESFSYPADYSSVSPYNEMILRNIVNPVVEQTGSLLPPGASVTTELSRVKVDYDFRNGTAFIEPVLMKKSVGGNVPETEMIINEHDNKGNILRTWTKNGISTVYVWGYDKRYPVAKVIIGGKTYAEVIVQSGLSESVINDMSASDVAVRTELAKLRSLPGSVVTTFTYKHPLGMTSETDPNGFTKYYEYDQFGRLVIIRDKDNNILRKVCYNYTGQPEDCPNGSGTTLYQSDAMSQIFTKNDCPDCQVGSQVSYSLPFGAYTSTVSKIAANQLALADLNTNGQINANNAGACSPGTGIVISYANPGLYSGYTATYTNLSTSQVYVFNVPGNATGNLGCIPAGAYSLEIVKAGGGLSPWITFGTGCQIIEGQSAYFGNVDLTNCHNVLLDTAF